LALTGPIIATVSNDGNASDLYDGLGRPQFGDTDGRPGWIGRFQKLSGDPQHEVGLASQVDVVRVDFNNV
jgi:hypothetical protein